MSRVFPEGARRAGGSVQGGTVAERSALLEHSWPQGCQQDVGCADKCFAKKRHLILDVKQREHLGWTGIQMSVRGAVR